MISLTKIELVMDRTITPNREKINIGDLIGVDPWAVVTVEAICNTITKETVGSQVYLADRGFITVQESTIDIMHMVESAINEHNDD